MKTEALIHFPYIGATCAALILFFSLFSAMLIYIHRKHSKDIYRYSAQLPLNSGDTHD